MSEITATREGKTVRTGKVRVSYLNWKTPKASMNPGGEPKYSAALLLPKTDETGTLKALKAAAIHAGVEKYGTAEKVTEMLRTGVLRSPFRDGDQENAKREAQGKRPHEEWKGVVFVNVSSTDAPQVVDRNKRPIVNAAEFRSGDFALAHVNAFCYAKGGNTGISFGINAGFQKVESGPPLGNRKDAQDAFDSVEGDEEEAAGSPPTGDGFGF